MSSEFKNNQNFSEKVHYTGELRIIGQIVNKLEDKNPIGYLIMTEKTKQMKPYTVEQTMWLISKFTFVNAEVSNDKIINTECAMDKLMKFSPKGQPLETNKAMVLGKIFVGDRAEGFRVLSPTGNVVDIDEYELLEYYNQGVQFVNAKIVSGANDSKHISAIKKEFTKIEKSKVQDVIKAHKHKKNYAHEKKLEKIESINRIGNTVAEELITNLVEVTSTYNMHCGTRLLYPISSLLFIAKLTEEQKLKTSVKIICKEISPKHGKEAFAKKVVNAYNNGELEEVSKLRGCSELELALWLLLQIVVNDKQGLKNIEYRYKNKYFFGKRVDIFEASKKFVVAYKKLEQKGLILPNVKRVIDTYIQDRNNYIKSEIERYTRKPNPKLDRQENVELSFRSKETIDNMGFSIASKSERGKMDKGVYIRYLSDFITDYETYRGMANCLGDLVILAKIERVLKRGVFKQYRYSDKNIPALKDVEYKLDEDSLSLAEMLLGVLAIYRPDMAKKYIENTSRYVPELEDMLPGLDLDNFIDYKLSNYCSTFYKSGLCVLNLDASGKNVNLRSKPLRYRGDKETKQIKASEGFKAVSTELTTVVAMITSSECTDEVISNNIWKACNYI